MKKKELAAPVLAAVLLVGLGAVRALPFDAPPAVPRYRWQNPRAQRARDRFEELTEKGEKDRFSCEKAADVVAYGAETDCGSCRERGRSV